MSFECAVDIYSLMIVGLLFYHDIKIIHILELRDEL
jgi:hypothetical protein